MNDKSKLTREQVIECPDEVKQDVAFIKVRDSMLSSAVHEADVEFVRSLLAAGANPNHQVPWGDSLLHDLAHSFTSRRTLNSAAMLRTARTLLEAGANVNIVGCNNYMPINVARESGASELVQLLLEFGAKPEGSPFL
jgi:ankyrin repeat protein